MGAPLGIQSKELGSHGQSGGEMWTRAEGEEGDGKTVGTNSLSGPTARGQGVLDDQELYQQQVPPTAAPPVGTGYSTHVLLILMTPYEAGIVTPLCTWNQALKG